MRDCASMAITRETRYRGTYEGGQWAAFDVEGWDDIPAEAFGGDVVAAEWWWDGPSIVVSVGDTAAEAESRLKLRNGRWDQAEHPVGSKVRIAKCAPSEWDPGEVGRVVAQRYEPFDGRYSRTDSAQWLYVIELPDARTVEVPEPYLRPVVTVLEPRTSV